MQGKRSSRGSKNRPAQRWPNNDVIGKHVNDERDETNHDDANKDRKGFPRSIL
jgi:hypothetical protein